MPDARVFHRIERLNIVSSRASARFLHFFSSSLSLFKFVRKIFSNGILISTIQLYDCSWKFSKNDAIINSNFSFQKLYSGEIVK